MYVKCSQCKTRHRVTDENVRADRSSIKCRDCDTVIYFKNPPRRRVETEKLGTLPRRHTEQIRAKKKKEYSKPVSAPAKQVFKEEKRELKKPVTIPIERETEKAKEHKDTTGKIPSPGGTKTDATSTFQSVFDNISEKLEKLSEDDSPADFNPLKNINLGDKSTRRIIIFIVGGILLIGLIEFIFSRI